MSDSTARALGISRSHLWSIRDGRYKPSPKLALGLYRLTGEQLGILKGLDEAAITQIAANIEEDNR